MDSLFSYKCGQEVAIFLKKTVCSVSHPHKIGAYLFSKSDDPDQVFSPFISTL